MQDICIVFACSLRRTSVSSDAGWWVFTECDTEMHNQLPRQYFFIHFIVFFSFNFFLLKIICWCMWSLLCICSSLIPLMLSFCGIFLCCTFNPFIWIRPLFFSIIIIILAYTHTPWFFNNLFSCQGWKRVGDEVEWRAFTIRFL